MRLLGCLACTHDQTSFLCNLYLCICTAVGCHLLHSVSSRSYMIKWLTAVWIYMYLQSFYLDVRKMAEGPPQYCALPCSYHICPSLEDALMWTEITIKSGYTVSAYASSRFHLGDGGVAPTIPWSSFAILWVNAYVYLLILSCDKGMYVFHLAAPINWGLWQVYLMWTNTYI